MIENLDPNIRWGKKTIQCTFMQWKYSLVMDATVGGNVLAMDNLSCALDDIYQRLPEDGDGVYVILKSADGDELRVDDEDQNGENWLMEMLVQATLISVTEETP